MMAATRARRSDETSRDDEAKRTALIKPEAEAKLEDAVQRAMSDLEQENRRIADAAHPHGNPS